MKSYNQRFLKAAGSRRVGKEFEVLAFRVTTATWLKKEEHGCIADYALGLELHIVRGTLLNREEYRRLENTWLS